MNYGFARFAARTICQNFISKSSISHSAKPHIIEGTQAMMSNFLTVPNSLHLFNLRELTLERSSQTLSELDVFQSKFIR